MKEEAGRKPSTQGKGTTASDLEPVAARSGVPFMFRWFGSKTVRQATSLRKHVQRVLCAQRDVLPAQAAQSVSESLAETRVILRTGASTAALRQQMERLEETANKWLKPYPHHAWRENVEVFLVALAVAMAIRTFFVQPFKIPTGSMQPTLFGVASVPDFSKVRSQAEALEQARLRDNLRIPTGWQRVKEWFAGISYIDIKAKADGTIDRVTPPFGIRIINFWQRIYIGGAPHTILFPPDYGQESLERRAGLDGYHHYRRGESVVRLKIQSGDHLFVDRLSYNFRKPKRGEIIVFATAGVPAERRVLWNNMPGDQFYIKRLVGLGGETLRIDDNRHVFVNGRALDSSVRHFENVYSFDPRHGPANSVFSGHVTDPMMPYFPNGEKSFTIPDGMLMVFGDNTVSSLDSRYWGEFPETSVIGKSFFVYWPITQRFGWRQD